LEDRHLVYGVKPVLGALLLLLLLLPSIAGSNETIARDLQAQLARYGPPQPDSPQRQEALLEIDQLFLNDTLEPLRIMVRDMLATAISEITGSTYSAPTIWYLWNMGFVLKTREAVIGFDIGQVELAPLADQQKKVLAESLDVLFTSHMDGPHIDKDLVAMMREDAYAVCPTGSEEGLEYIADRKCTIIAMEVDEKRTIGSVTVEALKGDDGRGTPMRCFLVSTGGVKVLQTGDNHVFADWMKAGSTRNVDVLMVGIERNPWIGQAIEAMKPRTVIPGNLYDISHPKEVWIGFPYVLQLRSEGATEILPLFFGEATHGQASGGSSFPAYLLIVPLLVVGIGAAVVLRRPRPRAKEARRKTAQRCEKRYVERLCLTCRDYTLKGGRPYCRRHNFYLDSGP
jgi:L-ascorbate metabolism protein UlaG (beta-lactamase superfamily)